MTDGHSRVFRPALAREDGSFSSNIARDEKFVPTLFRKKGGDGKIFFIFYRIFFRFFEIFRDFSVFLPSGGIQTLSVLSKTAKTCISSLAVKV